MMNMKDSGNPVLLLDSQRCKRNITRMVQKTAAGNCIFRPHFKTHQSAEVGKWFKKSGIEGITVSSVSMAQYFASSGWTDITIAFPFYPAMLPELQELQKKSELRLFVNSTEDLKLLNTELSRPFSYYIEIDPGYGRSGIFYENKEQIDKLVTASEKYPNAAFHGFYIHDGRTYRCTGKKEVLETIQPSVDILLNLKRSYPHANISLGDTPSASLMDDMSMLDECTAGNFVFYDWTQVQIGSCTPDDVALFVMLPVAQLKKGVNTMIIKGGAVHLSKDYVSMTSGKNFGQLIRYSPDSTITVNDEFISAISQEHGTIHLKDNNWNEQTVTIIPAHSCLTANLHGSYTTERGEKLTKRILS